MRIDDIRDRLVQAASVDLNFDGFSDEVLSRAAMGCGLSPADIAAACPRGVIDLACRYSALRDLRLAAALAEVALAGMQVRMRITTALRIFARLVDSARETEMRMIRFFAQPRYLIDGAAALASTADVMWTAAGDRSTDFNYYSKRASLSAVISAVTLFQLQGDGVDMDLVDAFIDRRINDVMRFEKWKAQFAARLPSAQGAAAVLGRMRYGFFAR